MKNLIRLLLILIILPCSFSYADEADEETDESNGGIYNPYIKPDSSFFEYVPFIGGKNKEVRLRHCVLTVNKACPQPDGATTMQFAICKVEFNKKNCAKSCLAWVKDCGDFSTSTIKDKLREEE